MQGSWLLSQAARLVAPLILLLSTLVYLSARQSPSAAVRHFGDEKAVFVANVLTDGLDRDGGSAIADVCVARNWTRGEGVVFTCEAAAGGPAQVRNAHLTCLRLAIEAGAEVVLPRIVRRPDTDRSKLKPNSKGFIKGEPMSYFFDEDHAVSTLRTWCPQLKVHRSLDDLYQEPTLLSPHKVELKDIVRSLDGNHVIADPGSFGDSFHEWLDRAAPMATRRMPLRVELAEPSLAWPLRSDTLAFSKQFGALLRTRDDVRELSGSALFALGQRFSSARTDPRAGWQPDSFVGIDLRTAYDAASGFPPYAEQAGNYLAYVTEWGLDVAYLTNGAADRDVAEFRRRAVDFNATVVQASDLLDTPERREVYLPFSWDQRALVDYEVVRRAGRFAGATAGAFAWDVAVRRRFGWNETETRMPEGEGGRTEHVQFRDDMSVLYGKREGADRFLATIWP